MHRVILRLKSDKNKDVLGRQPYTYNGASSTKTVNGWKLWTFFEKDISTVDLRLGSKYASEMYGTFEQIWLFKIALSVALSFRNATSLN